MSARIIAITDFAANSKRSAARGGSTVEMLEDLKALAEKMEESQRLNRALKDELGRLLEQNSELKSHILQQHYILEHLPSYSEFNRMVEEIKELKERLEKQQEAKGRLATVTVLERVK